jgi:tetratricopeptide (TPR) repeat protein
MLALQNISLSLIYLKNYEETVVYCDKVLEIKPSDTYAIKNKIFALENLKQYDQVLKLCEQLLVIDPKDTWALNSMGISLNELDRHQDAIQYYDTTLVIDPNDITALMNKAISLGHFGNYQDAINYYDLAQRIDSSLREIPSAKSKLFEKLNMPDEAFLAAQGVLNKDMEKIKSDAKENKCSVFHQFCNNEFENSNSK